MPFDKYAIHSYYNYHNSISKYILTSILSQHNNYSFWFLGTDYCGKRFLNSEELLVHLKTHTNLSTSDFRYASLLSSSLTSTTTAGASSSSIIPPHGSITASMASRYHPYARPESNIGSFPPNFPSSLTLPPSAAAPASYLNPYASLYSSLFARPPLI